MTDLKKLSSGRHGAPFAYLGLQTEGQDKVYRCFRPRVRQAWLENEDTPFDRVPDSDLFEWPVKGKELPEHPLLIWEDDEGEKHQLHDPYSFGPVLDFEAMRAFQGRQELPCPGSAGGPSHPDCRNRWDPVCRVGTQRRARERGRQFQSLGRAQPPDAFARGFRHLGIVRP